MIDRDIFEDLFVLEMANNHLGSLELGMKIVSRICAGCPLQQRQGNY